MSPGMEMSGSLRERFGDEAGRRRKMLSARRWTTRRPVDASSSSESSSGSPQSYQHTKTLTISRMRRRRPSSSQERLQCEKDLNSTGNPVAAGHESIALGYSRSPINPERAPTTAGARLLDDKPDEPISPSMSNASDTTPGWAERAAFADGTSAGKPLRATAAGDTRDVPRSLQPVAALLTISVVAIIGAKLGRGMGAPGSAVHATGGAKLQEAVLDDIFLQADKDNNGVIADEEIQSVSSTSDKSFRDSFRTMISRRQRSVCPLVIQSRSTPPSQAPHDYYCRALA